MVMRFRPLSIVARGFCPFKRTFTVSYRKVSKFGIKSSEALKPQEVLFDAANCEHAPNIASRPNQLNSEVRALLDHLI